MVTAHNRACKNDKIIFQITATRSFDPSTRGLRKKPKVLTKHERI